MEHIIPGFDPGPKLGAGNIKESGEFDSYPGIRLVIGTSTWIYRHLMAGITRTTFCLGLRLFELIPIMFPVSLAPSPTSSTGRAMIMMLKTFESRTSTYQAILS